jgi:tRNA(fMet)-specific endonuclease VapC
MAIVVDTNVISYFLKRDTRYKLYAPRVLNTEKLISFMTLAELRLWALERNWGEKRRAELEDFLAENYGIIFADDKLCEIWAQIKSNTHKTGNPIDTADDWVASVALQFDIPLVTHNRRHFENIGSFKMISTS